MTRKWLICLRVETDANPHEWMWNDTLIIDKPYIVMSIEEYH